MIYTEESLEPKVQGIRSATVGAKPSFLFTTILIALVIGCISTYLIVTKSNNLKNSSADAVVQGTTGWFDAQIARVNLIAETLAYEDYIGKRYDESEAFLADCLLENEAAYNRRLGGRFCTP